MTISTSDYTTALALVRKHEESNLDELREKLRELLGAYADTPGAREFVYTIKRAAGFDRDEQRQSTAAALARLQQRHQTA
jgi:hypothetical protein